MNNDIQEIVTDNISLKRAYQLSKLQNQHLEQEKNQKEQELENLQNIHEELSAKYSALQIKYKKAQAEYEANNNSFIYQIQQLKQLIEEKEQNLEIFQLKMIPNLDEDMLRVKLIGEMEGPYQQAIDKKDREINKLKDSLHKLRRDKEMLEYSHNSAQKNFKQQIIQLKRFYGQENQRLTKQLAHYACKKYSKTYSNQLLEGYRREIDCLKSTVEHYASNQDSLRQQILALKSQKDKLILEISAINTNNAVELSNASNSQQLKALKQQKLRLEESNHSLMREMEKIKTNHRNFEEEKQRQIKQLEREVQEMRRQSEKNRQSLREEIMDYKEEVRRLKDLKLRLQEDNMQISEKYQSIKMREDILVSENKQLKEQIRMNTSRYQQSISQEEYKSIESNIRMKYQKEMRVKIEQQIRQKIIHEHTIHNINENISPNKDDPHPSDPQISDQELQAKIRKIKELEAKIQKLSQKLAYANNKIMELLKEKSKWKSQQSDEHARKFHHSTTDVYEDLALEYRDCSFVPMCPPAILQGSRRKSFF